MPHYPCCLPVLQKYWACHSTVSKLYIFGKCMCIGKVNENAMIAVTDTGCCEYSVGI
jgi:hypothetical protein